jgi:hypothetical protein
LSSQFTLTGQCFVTYCHWPLSSLDCLVPDSCLVTVRNAHSISANFPFSLLERRWFLLFSDFLTLQDKHNIRTLAVNIKMYSQTCEKDQRSSFFFLIQINFIFADKVCIYNKVKRSFKSLYQWLAQVGGFLRFPAPISLTTMI